MEGHHAASLCAGCLLYSATCSCPEAVYRRSPLCWAHLCLRLHVEHQRLSPCRDGALEGGPSCPLSSSLLSTQLERVASPVCLCRRRLLPPLLQLSPTAVMLSFVPTTSSLILCAGGDVCTGGGPLLCPHRPQARSGGPHCWPGGALVPHAVCQAHGGPVRAAGRCSSCGGPVSRVSCRGVLGVLSSMGSPGACRNELERPFSLHRVGSPMQACWQVMLCTLSLSTVKGNSASLAHPSCIVDVLFV